MEDAAGILQRDALIGLNSYWRQKKFAYDGDGNLIYIGCHSIGDTLTSDDNWAVWKFSYTDGNLTDIEGPITGIYDDRATLNWN